MDSLQKKSLVWLVQNLEQFPVTLLSQKLPTRLKLKLLLHSPVVDICKLERTTFVSDIDMETTWKRCLEFCGDSKCTHSKFIRTWTAKELYFNKLCSVAVNCDLQLKGHRSVEARNLCKDLLLSAVDRILTVSMPHMCSVPNRYDAVEFATNASLMQYITTECGYYPRLLIFTSALNLVPHESELNTFVSQVEHVIFDPDPFKLAIFPSFCAYIIEQLFCRSLSHLCNIEFFNCEVNTWKCISRLLSAYGTSAAGEVLVLKRIAIVHDEEVDSHDVETVADIVASVLMAQNRLEEIFISNWNFSSSGRRTAKLLSIIQCLFDQPGLNTLSIVNAALTQKYAHSLIQSFLSCNSLAAQSLCLSDIHILEDCTVQLPFEFNPLTHDLSMKSLRLHCVDFNIFLPFLLHYSKLNFLSLALTYPKEQSQSIVSDVLNYCSLGSKFINLSGVYFPRLANVATCITSILSSTVLLELYLDSCFLTERNTLTLLTSNLYQAHSLCLLSACRNNLGHASVQDIKLFFSGICKLPQLHHFELNISSNFLTCSHLKIFRDTLIDTGKDCCLKKLTANEIIVEREVNDEVVLHSALSSILEDLSIEHNYSVISNNWLSADHIANM